MLNENYPTFNAAAHASGLALGDHELVGSLNQTELGVVRFCEPTVWERHTAEELLVVLDGEVDVYVDEDEVSVHLGVGDVVVVPKGVWHRQVPRPEVALLFASTAFATDHRPLGDGVLR